MTRKNQSGEITQGEQKSIVVTITTTNDLTGASGEYVLQKAVDDITDKISVVATVDAVAKTATAILTSTQTRTLSPQVYYHEMWVTSGAVPECVMTGWLTVNDSAKY